MSRSGHHGHADQRGGACGLQGKGAMGGVSLDLRPLGYRLLRGPLGNGAMARIPRRSGCAVSHSSSMDCPSMVPAAGQRIDCSCYCVTQLRTCSVIWLNLGGRVTDNAALRSSCPDCDGVPLYLVGAKM